VTLDRKDAGRLVELLADVLANAFHRTAAAASGALGFVMTLDARQVRRQRWIGGPTDLRRIRAMNLSDIYSIGNPTEVASQI
jgi:hypothetical protein